jgi:polar amino acid transport system permease protein
MVDFTLWDIFSNLMLAARWTLLLSLVAFAGGGVVGLGLLVLRLSHLPGSGPVVAAYVQLFQGTPLLMQLFLAYFGLGLALSFGEQLRHVVLPQAGRVAIAPTVGFAVQVVKGTALASVIGFIELTKAGTMISNATFKPFVVYACVALMYFAICYPLSAWSRKIERTLHARAH